MTAQDFIIGPLDDALEVAVHEDGGTPQYIVKHPRHGKVYRLPAEVYRILAGIHAVGSAEEFVAALPAVKRGAVLDLLRQARDNGLLDTGADQPAGLPRKEPRSILFIRLATFDPRHLLNAVAPFYRPAMSRLGVLAWLSAWVWAIWQTAAQGGFFFQQFEVFTYFSSWLWVYGLMALATLFHELGHAYVCRFYGGQVREVGLALYMGQIAAFANVTDAWLLPSRWRRIAVALGGVYYESYLALFALLVWLYAIPYTLPSQIALVFFVVASTRIALNLIPVLRLDGYWVLSDLLGEPNLRSRASAYLLSCLPRSGRYRDLVFTPRRWLKPVYIGFSLASLGFSATAITATYFAVTRLMAEWRWELRYAVVGVVASMLLLSLGGYYRDILQRYFVAARAPGPNPERPC
jgi:putative peptide zinc metalloprotease protein